VEAVLRAISDPRRREIIRLVRRRELSAGEIAARFDRARPEALAGVRSFVEEFWMDHLDRLKEAAEQEATEQEEIDARQ
jgi:ArsR family transcriptional regulator, arsenate/arsenite/antimonite-responsive transcriptional repressor